MKEATSCGGVVIFRGKILVLYKNYRNKYEGWVLPKGTVEAGEEFKETALREVKEETGVQAQMLFRSSESGRTLQIPDIHLMFLMMWSIKQYTGICARQTAMIPNRSGKNFLKMRDFINFMKRIIC